MGERERPATAAESETDNGGDTSGGEYVAQNDLEKTYGRNNRPHRPQKPSTQTQLRNVRGGERRRGEEDAG